MSAVSSANVRLGERHDLDREGTTRSEVQLHRGSRSRESCPEPWRWMWDQAPKPMKPGCDFAEIASWARECEAEHHGSCNKSIFAASTVSAGDTALDRRPEAVRGLAATAGATCCPESRIGARWR